MYIVGQKIQRVGAVERATGKAKYTADLKLPGMLYCKLLRSAYAHAEIINIDTARAEKIRGVKAILTYKNIPDILVGEVGPPDTPVLAEKARYYGDEIAAVAAESIEIAERACEAISVKYKKLPVLLTIESATRTDAPIIPPKSAASSNICEGIMRTMSRSWGDVDQALKTAESIFENKFSTAVMQHMALEPKAYIANWDFNGVTIWASTQHMSGMRSELAHSLHLPETRVRVIVPNVGGGFGGKGTELRYVLIVTLLSKMTGYPVKLVLTREEDMLARSRPATEINLKIGLNHNKEFQAIHARLTTYGGGYNGAITSGCTTSCLRALYRNENCKFDAISVYTNHPPTGQLRGIMNGPMSFAMLQMVDVIAEASGFNSPLEFIKKTHIKPDYPCDTVTDIPGCTLSSCGLDECIEKGSKAIKWEQRWKDWKTPVEICGYKRIGIGMTALVHDSANARMVSGAFIKLNMDGSADFHTPVAEIGNGVVTTQLQIAAEASGISLEDFRIINADTDLTPLDPFGQVASSSAHLRALAAQKAGLSVKAQLIQQAARLLDASPEELDIVNSKIFIKNQPAKFITIRQLMANMFGGSVLPIIGSATVHTPNYPKKAYSYGAHFALVEVNTLTGQVKVLEYVAAHDVGRAINPSVVEAQIQGGVLMGIGSALIEALQFNRNGKPVNLSTTDYKIMTAADSPRIMPIIIESNDQLGPFGAKGFAEAPLVGTAPCIANAIYNATGIRFRQIPFTPETILSELRESKIK